GFEYKGKAWALKPGHIYLLPGYRVYRHSCRLRLRVDWMHFRPASIELDLGLAHMRDGFAWPASQWKAWKNVYTRMEELLKKRPDGLSCKCEAMVLWALGDLIERKILSAQPGQSLTAFEPLKPALAYLNAHFQNNPSLHEVAAVVHLSPIYF